MTSASLRFYKLRFEGLGHNSRNLTKKVSEQKRAGSMLISVTQRPMRQVWPRLFVCRKKWVAPPRRTEYHWHPSGKCRSAKRVLRRDLMIPGEAVRRGSPGCRFCKKFFKALTRDLQPQETLGSPGATHFS